MDAARPDQHPQDSVEEWEQVRRSVAMLAPGAWAMRREQSLAAVSTVIRLLKERPLTGKD